jgi:hypothetical protein
MNSRPVAERKRAAYPEAGMHESLVVVGRYAKLTGFPVYGAIGCSVK